jgi:NADH-quinone oxidoreductase subunit J
MLILICLTIFLFVALIGVYHTTLFALSSAFPKRRAIGLPTLTLCLSTGVVFFAHPVHSLLALIVIFFNTAVLYLSAGAEFLAFTFLIVYVGAIAILFLFVIRLLNVKELTSAPRPRLDKVQKGSVVFAVFSGAHVLTSLIGRFSTYCLHQLTKLPKDSELLIAYVTQQHRDVIKLSTLLYTYYSQLFRLVALLLLTARLGAIVLATTAVASNPSDAV